MRAFILGINVLCWDFVLAVNRDTFLCAFMRIQQKNKSYLTLMLCGGSESLRDFKKVAKFDELVLLNCILLQGIILMQKYED